MPTSAINPSPVDDDKKNKAKIQAVLPDEAIIDWPDIDADKATVVIFADWHVGSPFFNKEALEGVIKYILANPNVYVVVCGDLMDNGLKISKTNSYEATMQPEDQQQVVLEYLSRVADRILCIVPGNHELRTYVNAGIDPLYGVATALNLHHLYRRYCATMFVKVGKNSKGKRNFYCIRAQHGTGGGSTGAAINNSEKTVLWTEGIDCYISGHVHRGALSGPCREVVDHYNKRITYQPVKVVVASPIMGYGGYAVQGRYSPSVFQFQQVILDGTKKSIVLTME